MPRNPHPRPMNSEKLDELLIEWDLQRQSGHEPTVDELCSACPELRHDLLDRINRLKATDWLFEINPDEVLPASSLNADKIEAEQLLEAARAMPVQELRARLLNSDLLPPGHKQSVEQEFTDTVNCASLLETLIGRNVLTPFQARTLCAADPVPLVLGDYVLLELLGAGGMGQVYRARHRQLDRVVALKILPQSVIADPLFKQRFQREIRALSTLTHPNIVTAFDAREEQGVCFLSMECVEGEDLHARVRRDGPLELTTALDFVIQAAEALEFAHANGIVHRDIKPSNLLLTNDGTLKVADFGLAQIEQSDSTDGAPIDASLTATGLVLGSLDFLAPEQAHSARDADQRSDIYSLGCTLYYLVTGRVPFEGENPVQKLVAHREQAFPSVRTSDAGLPDELDDVLSRMIAKAPSERFQTVADCLVALLSIGHQSELPVADARRKDSNRWIGVAKALVFAITVTLGALIYFNTGTGRVEIEVHRDDITVEINGVQKEFEIISPRERIAVAVDAGSNRLKVTTSDGLEFYTTSFRIFRHGTTELTAEFKRIPGTAEAGPGRTDQPDRPARHSTESPIDAAIASNWSRPETESKVAGILPMPTSFDGFDWNLETVSPRVEATSVAWSPNGQLIAVGDNVGVIRVYNADDLSLKSFCTTKERGRSSISQISWKPDGQSLASVSRVKGGNPICRIWSTDGRQQHSLLHSSKLASVSWSGDGSRLVCGTEDGSCVVWLANGKRDRELEFASEGAVFVDWSYHRNEFHVLANNGTIYRCNAEEGSKHEIHTSMRDLMPDWPSKWPCLSVAPDGRQFAFANAGVWKAQSSDPDRTVVEELKHNSRVSSVAWSGTGEFLATGVQGATEVVVWSKDGRKQWSRELSAVGNQVYVDWNPVADHLVVVDADGTILVLDANGEIKAERIGHHRGYRSYIAFSPNGDLIATNGNADELRIWRSNGDVVASVNDGRGWGSDDAIAWSPGANQVLAGAKLFSANGRVARKWPLHELHWADWNEKTNLLAVVLQETNQATSAVIATPDGDRIYTLDGHTGTITHIDFDPDGLRVATSSADKTVRIWDATGRQLKMLSAHERAVNWVTWSPDGAQLASGDTDGMLVVCDRDGEVVATEILNRGQIRSIEWSADGKWLAIGLQGAAVILWEVNGHRRLEINGLRTYGEGVSWGRGNLLATFGLDNRLIIWNTVTGNSVWTGVTLHGGRAATFRADGTLLDKSHDATASEFVYRVDHHDGRTEFLSLPEFRKLTIANN